MSFSRRQFMKWTAAVSSVFVAEGGRVRERSLLAAVADTGFRPNLLPG